MIGKLSGIVDHKGTDHVLIDVRGVGYIVHVSDRVLAQLPGPGQAVSLYTDLLVREDLLQLFGFPTLADKEWHRLLMTVQGVGAKAALGILGVLAADGLSRAIALGDWNAVARARGVGPKTAQRVVLDLKDKAPSLMAMAGRAAQTVDVVEDVAEAPKKRAARAPDPSVAAAAEALSALSNLGYGPSDAAAAVAEVQAAEAGLATPALIRAALKRLAPK